MTIKNRTAVLRKTKLPFAGRSLLLVDDDLRLLDSTRDLLEFQGFTIQTARNLQEARNRLAESNFDLLLTDLRLDEGCGLEILKAAQGLQPDCCRLAMSGYATARLEVLALEAGAHQVLHKPLDDQFLTSTFDVLLRRQRTAQGDRQETGPVETGPVETARMALKPERSTGRSGEWFGSGGKMREVFDLIDRVADSKASILITGEPGTGKSKLARTVHALSDRRGGPFVEVACGAIPEALLESELFGHTAGAFTGAIHSKLGKFQYAQGGTLFLDEIATASPAMQVRLLRVLQERSFEALGSNETVRTDARMIFATNEDLEQAVSAGRFRQDLFYRIHVVPIALPPLRDRLEDVGELADGFLAQACQEFDRQVEGFSPGAYRAMTQYPWPGNVRELENTIQRAVLVCLGQIIQTEDIERLLTKPFSGFPSSGFPSAHRALDIQTESSHGRAPAWSEQYKDLEEALGIPEKAILLGALRAHGWNRNATAQRLGINRTTLYKKMKRLGIECAN
jgi:DNA-binding NtrC family response regulator